MKFPVNNTHPTRSKLEVVRIQPSRRRQLHRVAKVAVLTLFSIIVLPRLGISWVNRLVFGHRAFLLSSESIAQIPGMRGVYLRQAFYRRTLAVCGRDIYFGWNSVFSMSQAEVGDRAYIGRFCSIGFALIEEEVMLADHVQILSGGQEHGRSQERSTMHQQPQTYRQVCLGRGAWIGAGAIIMADVGPGAIVGAGAVVNKAIPANCVAVGVPARVVKSVVSNE